MTDNLTEGWGVIRPGDRRAQNEPEWDSQDSADYHDGYERGEADVHTDCTLSTAMREAMSRPWLEGYEDGCTTAAERAGGAFTAIEYDAEFD